MESYSIDVGGRTIPVHRTHTLVIGSGAASLNAADRLHQFGITDLAIVTEDLAGGTSRNTGSDKQTYYKLAVASQTPDSPYEMAQALFAGGSMHGDLALIEAMESLEAFYHLLSIGVPFPANRYGGVVGYKTDHDPKQRGTSIGPYTSKVMVECLLAEVVRRGIPIFDHHLVIKLLTQNSRAYGALAMDLHALQDGKFGLALFVADNTIFGVGGPGGLYHASVYPLVHTGAIGLALEAGAEAVNLTESQYGLASTKFRWNVSGTYQQVIPRYISTTQEGKDPEEFLRPFFSSLGEQCSAVFLKGYQWPFDPRKIENNGSSLIDILVYRETVLKGRRVFLDYRSNPGEDLAVWGIGEGGAANCALLESIAHSQTPGVEVFRFESLSEEACQYLKKSEALFGTPIDRLRKMNPLAIELYRTHGIDLEQEALEIAVCAQHNNGGLAADLWWESTNLDRLFPVGEVNGSHGVYRPGGSALNSGQVGSIRAARKIAEAYGRLEIQMAEWQPLAERATAEMLDLIKELVPSQSMGAAAASASCKETKTRAAEYREELQLRMTKAGAHIRGIETAAQAVKEGFEQMLRFPTVRVRDIEELPYALVNRHLGLAHAAYLSAIEAYLKAGGGSRGSYLVMDARGKTVHPLLEAEWKYKPEAPEFGERLLVTNWNGKEFQHRVIPARPIPKEEFWFETTWLDHREKRFYRERGNI